MSSPIMQVSQEDINSYQRSLDARTEEVLTTLTADLHRANNTSREGLQMYNELLDAFKQQGEDLRKTRNKYYIASAASCCALVACTILYFAAECK